MKKHVILPIQKNEAAQLHAGDSVLLSGIVYTARDAAHNRLVEAIEQGKHLPFDLKNSAIYYVGPSPAIGHSPIGSAGPTTSVRCDKYTPLLLENGLTVMIGKGKRSQPVKDAIIKHSAVYMAAIGGAGAMLSSCIKESKIIAYEDLGTEAIRELRIENFPAIVINDCHGGDYYQSAREDYLKHVN